MILRPSSPFATEYTYDLPSPSTTQHYYSSAMPRSISPLHFSSSSSHGKQASRAADISRLLDPSYSSQSTKSSAIPTAYVDIHGDLHDPDYRHFPISPSRNHNSSHHHARRHGRTSPRLNWELQLADEYALDDEYEEMLLDEEEEGSLFLSSAAHPQNHHRYSASTSRLSSRSRSARQRDGSFSTTYSMYSPTYYSSTATSTFPTSYESDKTLLSQLGGDSSFDEKKSTGTKKRRRLSRGDKEKEKFERERSSMDYNSRDLPATTEEDDHYHTEEKTSDDRQVILGRDREEIEYVPTCGQSLRRQWQAFSLRFRFGVFRAQRRMMRRVHSLL